MEVGVRDWPAYWVRDWARDQSWPMSVYEIPRDGVTNYQKRGGLKHLLSVDSGGQKADVVSWG